MSLARRALPILLLIIFTMATGFFGGYYEGTGEFPRWFAKDAEYILPPESNVAQTFDEVQEFVVEDTTDQIEYQEGFNCIDYTLAMLRAAQWHGVAAEIVKIEYPDLPHHAVLMFPTSDRGLVFYETQTDKEIELSIGKIYNSRRVTGLYVMTMQWVPIDSYLQGMEIE